MEPQPDPVRVDGVATICSVVAQVHQVVINILLYSFLMLFFITMRYHYALITIFRGWANCRISNSEDSDITGMIACVYPRSSLASMGCVFTNLTNS